jgi:ParB-like chromosome segregation protein Spo0J
MTTITWRIEKRKISDLKDYHKNARVLSTDQAAQLKASLERFGLIDKPIINTDNTIIGGHQRKSVLKKMGYKEIECSVPDRTLTDEEVEELNVRHNKNHGSWDYDILANEYDPVALVAWGFKTEELFDGVSLLEDLKDESEKKKKFKKCPECGHEF